MVLILGVMALSARRLSIATVAMNFVQKKQEQSSEIQMNDKELVEAIMTAIHDKTNDEDAAETAFACIRDAGRLLPVGAVSYRRYPCGCLAGPWDGNTNFPDHCPTH
jgi:hypothetical protein